MGVPLGFGINRPSDCNELRLFLPQSREGGRWECAVLSSCGLNPGLCYSVTGDQVEIPEAVISEDDVASQVSYLPCEYRAGGDE